MIIKNDLTLIVREISELYNQYAHTQISKIASDNELTKAEALISVLFSLLFVKYFIEFKITFSTAPEVLSAFSHLLPVTRFNTLKRLIDNQVKENIMPNLQMLDKFILAKVKYQSWEEALLMVFGEQGIYTSDSLSIRCGDRRLYLIA